MLLGIAGAEELGARLDGSTGVIGPSGERMLKLIQSTLVVVSKPRLRVKWIQVIAMRWVHCMSFRRATISFLDVTWRFIPEQVGGQMAEARVRSELLNCVCGVLLMHTNLRAAVSG